MEAHVEAPETAGHKDLWTPEPKSKMSNREPKLPEGFKHFELPEFPAVIQLELNIQVGNIPCQCL